MKICPKCSTEFEDKFNFCRLDGTSLQVKALTKTCPGCGKEAEEGKKFCRHCGARLESEPKKSEQLVDHTSLDSHVPKAEPAVTNLLSAQFPSNYTSAKTQPEIQQTSKSCSQCGKEVDAGKKFCRHCGARIESSTEGVARTDETPRVHDVVSHQQFPAEPRKPAAGEKVAEKIERQVIQREEIVQQSVPKQQSPIEVAEKHLKEGNYKSSITALERIVKNNQDNHEARLLYLLASIKLYNVYGYENQIDAIKSLSNLSEKERGLAREIFLVGFEEARQRGREDEAREYQRLASRVILGQPLTEPASQTKAQEPSPQRGEVKPFPQRTVERVPQSGPSVSPSSEQGMIPPRKQVAVEPKKKSRAMPITVGIVLGVAGVLGGGALAYYARNQGVTVSSLFGKIFSGKEQLAKEKRHPGKSDVAQVLAAEELGFKVWGTGATDANRRESLLSEKIASQLDGLRNFYQQQSQKKPDLMGSVILQLTVSPTGQVTKVEEFASQIKDSEFKKSVVEEAYKWRFSQATSGLVKINYPILFLPAGMDVATLVKWEQSIGPRVAEPAETREVASASADPKSTITMPPEPSPTGGAKVLRPAPPPSGPVTLPPVVRTAPPPAVPIPQPVEPVTGERPPVGPAQAAAIGAYEVVHPTSVYSEPREDSRRLARVEAGTRVNVVDIRGEWLEVRSRQGRPPGFIKRDSAVPSGSR